MVAGVGDAELAADDCDRCRARREGVPDEDAVSATDEQPRPVACDRVAAPPGRGIAREVVRSRRLPKSEVGRLARVRGHRVPHEYAVISAVGDEQAHAVAVDTLRPEQRGTATTTGICAPRMTVVGS